MKSFILAALAAFAVAEEVLVTDAVTEEVSIIEALLDNTTPLP